MTGNVDYSAQGAFRGKVLAQMARLRNRALGYRYGGRREAEEIELAGMARLAAIAGVPAPTPARLVTKGLAV